jgi:hypothetical protein
MLPRPPRLIVRNLLPISNRVNRQDFPSGIIGLLDGTILDAALAGHGPN